ncbi:hypothetical protein LIPSTDRAFT_164300 [Lipomyces starkeyi NRRL Y-11557]|uniref:Uncharacterized protein n=1 Tax=Lipomyces starkeyi NRRL Y-11557 TaxID=675824 RepID=A0A1E3PZT9_LIPST|nr:hypothetical protein LIPSTDRAFT_164300 [Lipomyces starkeyi NRRL Y-11557]
MIKLDIDYVFSNLALIQRDWKSYLLVLVATLILVSHAAFHGLYCLRVNLPALSLFTSVWYWRYTFLPNPAFAQFVLN